MAAISDRLQKLKQSLSSSSKSFESSSSNTKDPFSVQSSQTSISTPNSLNTIGVTLNSAAPSNTIALDSGAYSIKVGECTDKKPLTNVIPNCILKAKAERKRVFIGNEIDDCRDLSGLYYQLPCHRGYVSRWDLQKTIWTQTVKPYLNDDTTLIMTQPIINFKESQEAMDEIFFEDYYIKAMCRRYASDYLVFNHMQRHGNGGTCIVVDSGYSSTWIIPYVDGVVYKKGLMRIDIGGKLLTNHMKEILSYRQLNVMEETYIINQMKEDACYVARSFNRDMQVAKRTGLENTIARTYVLPDFNTIRRGYIADPDHDLAKLANSYQLLKLNNERFTVPELLFQPSMIGFQQMGVAEAIAHTINRMPDYMQRTLCGNVILSGGCTKLLGFKNRLGKDLRSLTPSKYAVELFVSADPVTWAWRCAASFAKLSDLNSHCVTRAQYEEHGSRFVYDKFETAWDRDIEPAEPQFTEEKRPSLLNYNENVFAVPKINDTVIVISDTEEAPVEQTKSKVSINAVPALSPLSNSNQVQTRSSQLVLNCPPLIITGPSAQAARAAQPRKIQIEQCLSIMGGRVVDQTSECFISQIPISKQQATEQAAKPLYMTDGRRLFRADGSRSITIKTSSKPHILNPGYVATESKQNKTDKKRIRQRSVLKRSQELKPLQPKKKHNVVDKIPRVEVIPTHLPCDKQQTKVKDIETKPTAQTVTQTPQPKPKHLNTSPLSIAQQSKSKQLAEFKVSTVSVVEVPSISEYPKCKVSDVVPAPESSQSQPVKLKQSTESKTAVVSTVSASPEPQTQPVTSRPTNAPQKIILKRRFDPPKQKPVESTPNTSSASSPNVLIRLNMLSKESIYQLKQVTKVILEPLSQSTLEAVAMSSAATSLTSESVGVTAENVEHQRMDEDMQSEQYDEPIASTSNGGGARSVRLRREIRTTFSLKRRCED